MSDIKAETKDAMRRRIERNRWEDQLEPGARILMHLDTLIWDLKALTSCDDRDLVITFSRVAHIQVGRYLHGLPSWSYARDLDEKEQSYKGISYVITDDHRGEAFATVGIRVKNLHG